MLTPPKWHSVWLKSQYSSKNFAKKTMFFKQAHSLFDELRKCCNSTSKDLTLEALNCWKIWIENQQEEDWKENETCYAAVRPLLTKKFHPLHRDVEVSETKLSLMWLVLQKTQHLMQLEGPQHILEVFIQSCLSWLSCSDDVGSNTEELIFKLLKSLFSINSEIHQKNEKFPPLKNDIWKSNKLFCRLVTLFLEIFQNWTKLQEKTDLIYIWKHFLDHCEQSFKLIPVAVWHKIFKLVDSICSDQKELMRHKMSMLHKCAISLKSVLSNSKFIDCSQVLTTPAEALLKIVIELSISNKDENIPFDIFQYCLEISQVLSSCITNTFGYEFFIHMLSKIEDIESKPLLWGLWCGLAACFREQVLNLSIENYSKMEFKLYRKLRSVAVNFDLDKMILEASSLILIQDQLNFLRIPMACINCSKNHEKIKDGNALEITASHSEKPLPKYLDKELQHEFTGNFGIDISTENSYCVCLRKIQKTGSLMEIDIPESIKTETEIRKKVCLKCRHERYRRACDVKTRWVVHCCGMNYLFFRSTFGLRCYNVQRERLTPYESRHRRRISFAPACLPVLLEELCNIAKKDDDQSTESFVEKVKKVQVKVREGEIATPIKLFVSFKGNKGTEFYSNAVKFWDDLDEIVHDLDLLKNLKILKTNNNKSVVRLSMFFFLVNFVKNLYFEDGEKSFSEFRKLDDTEEKVMTERLVNFMRKVTYYKSRFSNFVFLDNMNRVLPTKRDNPLILWTNFISARHSKTNKNENSVLRDALLQETCCKLTNDNLINIFNCFEEFENKVTKKCSLPSTKLSKRRKKVRDANEGGRCSLGFHNRSLVTPLPKEVKVMENESVGTVNSPPNIFRSISITEWKTESTIVSYSLFKENKATKKRRNIKSTESEMPRKRSRHSSTKKTLPTDEIFQDENVNIENSKSDSVAETVIINSSITLSSSPRSAYSLRKRPLQRPSKFNDMKCLFADDFTKVKSLNRNSERDDHECGTSSPCDCATKKSLDREKCGMNLDGKSCIKIDGDTMPVVRDSALCNSNDNSENLVSPIVNDNKDCAFGAKELQVDVKEEYVVSGGSDFESQYCEAEISELINSLIEEIESGEDHKMNCAGVKIKSIEKVDAYDGPVYDSLPKGAGNKGVKRRLGACRSFFEEATAGKKLKAEAYERDHEEEPEQEESASAPLKQTRKPEMLVIQNRGSRMLALIPESPKLNGFHDSSLSRHQTMKPPNVMKNSRASRMLALLPELQEPAPNVESVSFMETTTEKTFSDDDNNTKGGFSGYTLGIMHHLTPNRKGSTISLESLKGSPLRQRRSIRFDDDRNETITYLTDSPPCETVKHGMRFRRCDK